MPKFPVEAPKRKVIRTFQELGFQVISEREHIALARENQDGTRTPMTIPIHPHLESSTLRTICTQAGIARDDFLRAYQKV